MNAWKICTICGVRNDAAWVGAGVHNWRSPTIEEMIAVLVKERNNARKQVDELQERGTQLITEVRARRREQPCTACILLAHISEIRGKEDTSLYVEIAAREGLKQKEFTLDHTCVEGVG